MIPNRLISYYVDRLTPEEALRLARRYGVPATMDEIEELLPFIREHKNELHRKNKETLLIKLRSEVQPSTYAKVQSVLAQFLE